MELVQMKEPNNESIGDRIAKVRGSVSRDAFAPTVGVSKSTLQRYEIGEREPDASFLIAMHEHYGVSPLWLLTGEGPIKVKDTTDESSGRISATEIALIVRDVTDQFDAYGIGPERYDSALQRIARIGYLSGEIYNKLRDIAPYDRKEARRNMALGAAFAERLRIKEREVGRGLDEVMEEDHNDMTP